MLMMSSNVTGRFSAAVAVRVAVTKTVNASRMRLEIMPMDVLQTGKSYDEIVPTAWRNLPRREGAA
jgi:hypothetical protein